MEQDNPIRNPIKSVVAVIVLILIVYIYSSREWLIIVAIAIGVLSITFRNAADKIDFLWFKLSWILGKILPNVLLTLIFYLLLMPLAFLSRLFGKKDLLKLKDHYSSLYIKNTEVIDKKYFERLW